MSQLSLQWSAPDRDRANYAATLDIVKEVVARTSLKEVAFRLGVAAPALAHALAERDRHYMRLDWLPAIMEMADDCDLAGQLHCTIGAPARLMSVEAKPLTPEQRLAKLEAALSAMPEINDAVLKRAGLSR